MSEVPDHVHGTVTSPELDAPATRATETGRRADAGILILCVTIALLSRLLHVAGGNAVSLDAQGAHALRPICVFRSLFGLNCPGCGLVRSFVSLGHGDFAAAWRFHRVGPLLFALILLEIPHRALRLAWPSFGRRSARLDAAITTAAYVVLGAALLINWLAYLARVVVGG